MSKTLVGVGLAAAIIAGSVGFYIKSSANPLPKLSDDNSIVGEAEFKATKIPCRALMYGRFGEKARDVKSTYAWRKDGYAVVEMAATTEDGQYEFRLCVVNPSNPSDAILLEERDRPYWFEPDSETTFY